MSPQLGGSHISASTKVSEPWRRVANLVGILWVPVGLVVAFVSAQAGFPKASGWLFIVAGLVMVWILGRRFGVSGKRNWARAAIRAVAVLWVIGTVVIFMWAMAGSPGIQSVE